MFEFEFSNKKIISRNTESYPVTIDDIKELSEFYSENPDSTKYNSFLNNIMIPRLVDNWEKTTGFILLDTQIQAFVEDIGYVMSPAANIGFTNLNIREVLNIKYYPIDWDLESDKTVIESTKYLLSSEINKSPIKLNIKPDYLPFSLYFQTNNLEANYKAGYENNDFSSMPDDIKQAIAMQCAMTIDIKESLGCNELFVPFIEQTYVAYKINEQVVTFIR